MSIKMQAQVLGAKGSKGTYEGVDYDYTKLYVVLDVSDRSGTEVGFNASPMVWGLAENFEAIKNVKYPAMFDLEVRLTTKGYEVENCKVIPANKVVN